MNGKVAILELCAQLVWCELYAMKDKKRKRKENQSMGTATVNWKATSCEYKRTNGKSSVAGDTVTVKLEGRLL